jgi:hypothetical protein
VKLGEANLGGDRQPSSPSADLSAKFAIFAEFRHSQDLHGCRGELDQYSMTGRRGRTRA